MARPSLNGLCPCGSGKRFRKCCAEEQLVRLPRLLRQAEESYREMKQREAAFIERYGHIRMPIGAAADGKRYFAVGSRIYVRDSEDDRFVIAVHDIGLLFFGEEFLSKHEQLPFEERHPAVQWMNAWVEEHNRAIQEEPGNPSATQRGAGAAWLRLAFDLYTISDNAELQAVLKQRLLSPSDFQAARYELKIAALWIAAGFTLEFENERNVHKTHPEFIAVDRFSDVRVAVEVKSRHRPGIQGFAGAEIAGARRPNVRTQLMAAYRKQVDLPLYVFMELNLPPATDEERVTWVEEIYQTLADMTDEGYHSPSPANLVVFTNDPSHYSLRERIDSELHNLWWLSHEFQEPRVPHPDIDIRERIEKAFRQRVAPPDSFYD